MSLPVYSDYNGLAWAFRGEPFCNVAVTLHQTSFRSLDRVFRAAPFAGTTGPVGQEDTRIYSLPITITIEGSVSDVAFHRPALLESYDPLGTLDHPFRGEPYADVTTDVDKVFIGLDIPFRGEPFVLTSVQLVPVGVEAVPATVSIGATVGAIAPVVVLAAAGRIDLSGGCGPIWELMTVPAPPGVLTVGGGTQAALLRVNTAPAQLSVLAGMSEVIIPVPIYSVAAVGELIGGVYGVRSLRPATARQYECRLTGDGVDDIVIPISSLQSRQRAGAPSYAEVTIPGLAHLQDIMSMPDAEFVISLLMFLGSEAVQREILFRSPIDTMVISGNEKDQTIILSGYRTEPENTSPKTIAISGVSYSCMDKGTMAIRKADPDPYLRPGDSVEYDGDLITAGTISYSLSGIYGNSMEIRDDG